MSSTTSPGAGPDDQVDEGRRDFIHLLAFGTAGAAAVGAVIPVVHQMNPAADVRALATKEVSIAGIEPGQGVKVIWQGKPVFIRRLTDQEINETEEMPQTLLKDHMSENENAPGEPANAQFRLSGPDGAEKNFIIVLGVCTHLGCVPLGTQQGDPRGDYGGWFCPCHGSHYDPFGRIIKGPAPKNLAIPPLQFVTDSTVRLG